MAQAQPAAITTENVSGIVDRILGDNGEKYANADRGLIASACVFALAAHEGQKRASGEPYVSHSFEVARILADRRLDASSIAAGVLHDTIEDGWMDGRRITQEELTAAFGPEISGLVQGVTKISSLQFGSRREQQVENLRKMMLAMAKDIRVILIKLADRLHNIHTLRHLPPEKQLKIARDTMDIYAPLANRLGMTRVKSELEDGAMRFLHPNDYRDISRHIDMKKAERDAIVMNSIRELETEIVAHGLRAEITGRSKHLYSIYIKMTTDSLAFDDIYDLIGLRVICYTVPECYEILGIVHNMWRPIHGRFKDYIAMPKENMYQSLHTTVVGRTGERIEIQVRTAEMHKFAEEGIAAHWKYKEGKTGRHELEEKLIWLRQLTEWLNDVRDPAEFMDALKKDLFADTVFCFTPQGDVIELPAGATPIDFAYSIHTRLGEMCSSARVNNKMVPLRHKFHNGDFVEIITAKTAHPTRDWLDIVKTSRARTKIRHWLKTQNLPENIERGRDMLAKAMRARGIPVEWQKTEELLAPHFRNYKVAGFDELLGEIGFGGLDPASIILRAFPDAEAPAKAQPRKAPRRKTSQGVILDGIPSAPIRYANCCAPVPGDPIIGFVRGRAVNIHNRGCASLARTLETQEATSKLVGAEWDTQHPPMRRVNIRIECLDRKGLLTDVTGAITSMNIFILESKTKSKSAAAILKFLIEVKSADQLNQLFNQLRQVKGVLNLSRITRNDQN
ncbi:MAG: bifunctional (p)ppGpp synthetase/guanosine-3',5'-bis(diphosphate) 3'-pyrophosphohydrolase [Candidatus Sumerlaeota bacterium]|nr:bifunctional (p)ppGpp synthetase/guanosine-3',5'-bis(diphosphate) 3'-pyrophosphohydrolase [Candidatus Sumerlaeota bacterium]